MATSCVVARLAVEPFLGEFLVLFEQRDLLLFLIVLELHAQLRDFADAIERALFAHATQVFALVGERGRVVADGGMRARTQLVQLGDVVRRLRATGRDGAIELRHGILGSAERQEQAAAQRRQRAVVVVVHAAGLAERQFGAIAPARRLGQRIALDLHIAHGHLREARADAVADVFMNAQRFGGGDHGLVEPARGLEDAGAAVERRGETDLRLLFAEERDGFIHQRQRLRIVAYAELRHRQAARGHHGLFDGSHAAAAAAYERNRSSSAWSGLPSRKFSQPRSRSTQPSASGRSRTASMMRVSSTVAASMPPTFVLTTARTVRMRTARSDMSPAGSSARPASACVMLWRLKPSWRAASAAMACSAARRVRRHVGGRGDGVGELRQGRSRIAEGALFDRGEIAALRADAGGMGLAATHRPTVPSGS